jgi:hypothetical protein
LAIGEFAVFGVLDSIKGCLHTCIIGYLIA